MTQDPKKRHRNALKAERKGNSRSALVLLLGIILAVAGLLVFLKVLI